MDEYEPKTPEEKDLWSRVDTFLYPSWSRRNSYRPDLPICRDGRLLTEFYQGQLPRDRWFLVPEALAALEAYTEAKYNVEKREVLATMREHGHCEYSWFVGMTRIAQSTFVRLLDSKVITRCGEGFRFPPKEEAQE